MVTAAADRLRGRILGMTWMGIGWSVVWGFMFIVIGTVAGILRPQDIDPGDATGIVTVGFLVGFVSGMIFGLILAIAENRKTIPELNLIRMAVWGIAAAAVWPLITIAHDDMVFILCPLGALCAIAATTIARRENSGSERSLFQGLMYRLITNPLKAVCAGNAHNT